MSKQAKIILFCCIYILGIVIFFSEYIIPLSILLSVVLICLNYKKIISVKLLLILLLIYSVALINTYSNFKYDDELTSFADRIVNVKAKVLTIPSNNSNEKTSFYAKVYSIQNNFENLYTDINAKSLIVITDKKERIKNLKIGDTLILTGKVKTPLYAQNPSQFDYSRYLRFKKTFSLIYVESDWKIYSCDTGLIGSSLRKLNDIRTKIINIHAKNLKSPMIEILGGIIFGDDAVNPNQKTKTSFINSGIFHILAASGMNVTLIFGIWFFFARSFRFNYKFSIITGIALILFYTCMTGFGPPIIRASLMLILILLGKLLDRTTSTLSLLFIVGFLMLLFNPLLLFDIGFQLSFIVTFALIITAPLLIFNFKFKPFNYILGACMIPLIAQIFAAPLQMFYFNTFALYSVCANISIVPVLSIVSFVGFISSILAIVPFWADKVCSVADFVLNPLLLYITNVADFYSQLPLSVIYVKKPLIIQILLYFIIVIFIICILRFKLFYKKIYFSVFILISLFIFSFIQLPSKHAEIIFFSVGNADASLIVSPKKEYFLIDSGKLNYNGSSSQAKNIIIKYLQDKGIKKINSYILTHFDSDHAGGTIDILEYFNIKNILFSEVYEDTNFTENIFKYLKNNHIKYSFINNLTKIYQDGDFNITVFKPKGNLIKSENQNSLIVHCNYKDKNILIMADGDENSYNVLPGYLKENISVIRTGHHGAINTISEDMIKNSDLFVISTGPNIYNHPHPDTLSILNTNNKSYLRTDYHNAIKIRLEPEKADIFVYSPNKRKFIKIDL